jgi:CRP-like cAMP-binding protein
VQYCTVLESCLTLFCSMASSPVRSVSVKVARFPKKAKSKNPDFDVKLFLDSTGLGRKVGKFQGKETVFAQGDPAKNVMYIQEGGVKLTVVNTSGREAVIAILGPGDFFGEGCLAGQAVTICYCSRAMARRVILKRYSLKYRKGHWRK